MFKLLLATITTLRADRRTRWADDAHHCTVCGAAYGPNSECACP
jgi:hypothetical protein